ncbi:MAG: hypothetical protein ACP5HH_03570 [Fervidicoccaceae archaeon]
MSRNRKTVAIETELVDELSKFAKERGMTLAGYVRTIFSSAIQAEKAGMYPPNLIKEAMDYEVLKKLGFVFIPSAIFLDELQEKEIEEIGINVGRALSEISPNPREVFERYALSLKIAFPRDSSLLLPPVRGNGSKLRKLVISIAKGLGLEVEERGEISIIKLGSSSP